ncbi:MAG: lipopolysaccharide biosynthesis protein [Desulforhabdus sp.]|jgi:O-antigen/teichoic acid export membrane protein|nr:lipopolysaccharide biosynthesis protein [Desulforhabdus sp.]
MSDFWRNVGSVVTGTALAQIIPVLGSLIIARQYVPAEFGVFSAWLGMALWLAVVLTGRFEMALVIERDGEARRLAVLSTIVTACLGAGVAGLALAVGILAVPEWVANFPLTLILISIPVALAVAVAQTWQSWAAAEGFYRQLSLMRIAQAGAITLLQIGAGVFFASASALAIAYMLGLTIGIALSAVLMPVGALPKGVGTAPLRAFWRRHRRFPMFSLPADAINTAAAQLPVLLVAGRFGAEMAGLLAMAMRMLGTPISLLGRAVLDVFKRQAATSFRERGECRDDYLRTFKVLALVSLIFCAVMSMASEPLFVLAFGESWRGAGVIAVWLLPIFALRFMASPLSYMAYIAGKQHIDLIWQIALLGMTFISLSVPQQQDFALQAYSAGYSLLYIVYLVMSYRFSLGEKR